MKWLKTNIDQFCKSIESLSLALLYIPSFCIILPLIGTPTIFDTHRGFFRLIASSFSERMWVCIFRDLIFRQFQICRKIHLVADVSHDQKHFFSVKSHWSARSSVWWHGCSLICQVRTVLGWWCFYGRPVVPQWTPAIDGFGMGIPVAIFCCGGVFTIRWKLVRPIKTLGGFKYGSPVICAMPWKKIKHLYVFIK